MLDLKSYATIRRTNFISYANMSFDARQAKLLASGAHIIIDDCPGLRLKATASTRAWIYRYKSPIDGRMRQIKIGQWPKLSLSVAIAEWERLRHLRDLGTDPAQEKKAAKSSIKAAAEAERQNKKAGEYTVRRLVNDYLIGHIDRVRTPKSAKETRRLFDRMIDLIADVPAASVTRTQAFNQLEAHLGAPVLCMQLRAELGAAWDYALDAGRVPDTTPNWWRMIMRGKIKSAGRQIAGKRTGQIKRFMLADELAILIPWLPNFQTVIHDVLTIYLWTATRGAEICAMEGREISEEADGLWWTIPKPKTKNARHADATDHRVPLIGRAEKIVRQRLAQYGDGYLFPSSGKLGHIEQKYVSEQVYFYQPYCKIRPERVRERLPVTKWAPHDLRRSSRTLLAALGCPDAVAEAILGHMQSGIRGIYNRHTYDKERREWLTLLSDRLEALQK